LDWKVNKVKPRKTPIVMSLEKGQQQRSHIGTSSLQSLEDNDVWIERNRYAEREGLHQSECGEKHQVPWVGVSLPVEKAKNDQSTEKRKVERPYAIGFM